MAKGRSTFGCVQRMARDVYRLRWHEDTPEGRKRRSETVYGTRREAELRMAEIHATVGKSYGGAPTVAQCYERWWLPEAKARLEDGSLSKSSYVGFVGCWDNHICPSWGDTPIDQIKKEKIADWVQGMTSATAKKAKTVARQIIDFPVRYDMLESNPFDVKTRMPSTGEKHGKGVFDLRTLLLVSDAFIGSPAEPSVILCALGSCRVGESLAARREEIYRIEACGVSFAAVPISRQVPSDGGEVTDRLKTASSYRTVLIPGRFGDRILELAGRSDGWLCDDGTGSPMTNYSVNRMWTKVLSSIGVDRIPYRNLRNSWKTAMEHEVGVKHETIEKLMGHVSEGTSGKFYDRPDPQQLAESFARAYLDKPFANS